MTPTTDPAASSTASTPSTARSRCISTCRSRSRRGQIVCLLGGNASGKSTTMKIILGLVKPRSGEVTLDGAADHRPADAADRPPRHRLGARGAAPVRRHDGAREPADGRLSRAATSRRSRRIYERMLTLFPRLARAPRRSAAGTLSGGEQQMVAMARALMGRPRVICMDEPTMGLSPLFVDHVLELIQTVNKDGRHGLHGRAECQPRAADRRLRLCAADRPHCLSGPARDLLHDPRIRDAYLGGQAA